MRSFLILAFCGAASMAAAAPGQPPEWMSGHWLSCENGARTAETWVGAGSGTLVGINHTKSADGVSFEFVRIAANSAGRLAYFAMPGGAPVTEFPAVTQDERRIVFENLKHDFPQRIIYTRQGDNLSARVEGTIEGRLEGQDWRFRRAEIDARCD